MLLLVAGKRSATNIHTYPQAAQLTIMSHPTYYSTQPNQSCQLYATLFAWLRFLLRQLINYTGILVFTRQVRRSRMKSPVSLYRVLSFSPPSTRLSLVPFLLVSHLHSPFPNAHIFNEVHEYTPYVLRSEMDSINVGFPTFTRKCGLLLFNQSVIRIFLTSFLSVFSPGFFVLLFIFLFII